MADQRVPQRAPDIQGKFCRNRFSHDLQKRANWRKFILPLVVKTSTIASMTPKRDEMGVENKKKWVIVARYMK
ncbi:MAG: hypothetical protein K5660_04805 [Paludibacteraceae bacterium]|nr:hypothetical protein [Paludibacteraceae bacterium]